MSPRKKATVGNAADESQVRRGKETVRQREEREENDLRAVLASIEGRRFLWWLMEACRTYESVFSPDPLSMAFRSGQQDLGHLILGRITEVDPRALLVMMAEAGRIEDAKPDPALPQGAE